jgi:hypothetical protein
MRALHPPCLTTSLVPVVWNEDLVFPATHEDQNEGCDTAAGW